MLKLRFLLLLPGLLTGTMLSHAQSTQLDLPLQSQHAIVTQRLGVTDITINYHRPLANGRKIWGGLVPYGQVWRAGANENTTITFSDPVTIEGKPLAAGTYGLHMIPNEDQWTVIFSKMHTAWGSFSYDEKEDALRVTVKPGTTDLHNALAYDFDQLAARLDRGHHELGQSCRAVQGCGQPSADCRGQPAQPASRLVAVHLGRLGRRRDLPG